jgi:hypothetical protein
VALPQRFTNKTKIIFHNEDQSLPDGWEYSNCYADRARFGATNPGTEARMKVIKILLEPLVDSRKGGRRKCG